MEDYIKWLENKIETTLEDKDLQREHWAFCQSLKQYRKLNNLIKPDVSGSLQCTDKEYKEVMTAIYPKDRSKKFYRK